MDTKLRLLTKGCDMIVGSLILNPLTRPIHGEIEVPGDKSISHRAVMLGSLAKGQTTIQNFLNGEDCLQTIQAFRALGVSIEIDGTEVQIDGKGIEQLTEPKIPLYFGNSGTTARLMLGILAGLPFVTTVYGDPYLTERPMDRVVFPLQKMGAHLIGRKKGRNLPLAIQGGYLRGITYELPVKSAQVKSAILLAGLFADGTTTIIEQAKTRDHTENMLKAFGAAIQINGLAVSVSNQQSLSGRDIYVPGDISSAAFHLVLAAIVPGSELTIKNVGLNETRTGVIDVLQQMGAKLTIENEKVNSGERMGDIHLSYQSLQGITIQGEMIPRLIDELPIIALLATQAEGTTIIKDAEELRVKETDRIRAVVEVLSTLGAKIEETEDGMIIQGKTALNGGEVSAYGDHRMAMLGVIASTITSGPVHLDDDSSIAISYPEFFKDFQKLTT